jgi:uncharacterized coiled-coil DUF342 family protein
MVTAIRLREQEITEAMWKLAVKSQQLSEESHQLGEDYNKLRKELDEIRANRRRQRAVRAVSLLTPAEFLPKVDPSDACLP